MNRVSQNFKKKYVGKTMSYSVFVENITEICCSYETNKHCSQLDGQAPLHGKLDAAQSVVVCANHSLFLENKMLNVIYVKKSKDICSECQGKTVFFKCILSTVFFLLSRLTWQ